MEKKGSVERTREASGKRIRFLDVLAVCCILLCIFLLYGMLRPEKESGQGQTPNAQLQQTAAPETLGDGAVLPETAPTEAGEQREQSQTEQLYSAQVGDRVCWGSFEQDMDLRNGAESLEWIVLAKEGDKMLLISSCAIDCRPYHMVRVPVTWQDCTLRSWLNGDFFAEAFSEAEQERILAATVTPGKNPNYNTDPGSPTEDRVFLLSPEEVSAFGLTAPCCATDYAADRGAEKENCRWWLCAPGMSQNNATYIREGALGDDHVNKHFAVRPAIWIALDAAPEQTQP